MVGRFRPVQGAIAEGVYRRFDNGSLRKPVSAGTIGGKS